MKLGDFDSSTTVPGYGLKPKPHLNICYTSLFMLGTVENRVPEEIMPLNMHISGVHLHVTI